MEFALAKIANEMQAQALRSGSETMINRVDFISTCRSIHFFEDVSSKQLSIIYSVFDPMKRNAMRFVELISCLTLLDNIEHTACEKLKTLWKMQHTYGLDRNVFDIALDILCIARFNMEELMDVERLFKTQYRPKCYEHALNLKVREWQ